MRAVAFAFSADDVLLLANRAVTSPIGWPKQTKNRQIAGSEYMHGSGIVGDGEAASPSQLGQFRDRELAGRIDPTIAGKGCISCSVRVAAQPDNG